MFIGIEIGGTKLQIGVGAGDGRLAAIERRAVDPQAGSAAIRSAIQSAVPALLERLSLSHSAIHGVAIGFGGPVDTARGVVAKSHHVGGWDGFPLSDWVHRELRWPATLHNDADTAGLAESRFGAAAGLSPVFYITLGSGVGGGLIIDGRIFRGAGAGAGEIGHLCWDEPSLQRDTDPPSQRLTVENVCSGWSIESRTRSAVAAALDRLSADRQFASDLASRVNGDLTRLTCAVIADAARCGNELAKRELAVSLRVLGWAVAQCVAMVCPCRVVIGGGVSLIGEDLLFGPLREQVERFVFRPFRDRFDIVPAALGEAVVVHGALAIARDAARIQSG